MMMAMHMAIIMGYIPLIAIIRIGIEEGLRTFALPHHQGIRVRTRRFMYPCLMHDTDVTGLRILSQQRTDWIRQSSAVSG